MDNLDHFYLVKLMLADHTAGVTAIAACFRAETGGMGGELDGQLVFRNDGAADGIGKGDFCSRDEVKGFSITICATTFCREQVICEFRQLSSTIKAVGIDHIIALLSTWLGAEYWSRDESESCGDGESRTNINLVGDFRVDNIFFGESGEPLEVGETLPMSSSERGFGKVAVRYKRFIYRCCTKFCRTLSGEEKAKFRKRMKIMPITMVNDSRYAMVDLWEDIRHPLPDGTDLFSNDRPDRLT